MIKHRYGKLQDVIDNQNLALTAEESKQLDDYYKTIAEYPTELVNSDNVKAQEDNAAYLSKSFFMDPDGRSLYKAVMGKDWKEPENDRGYRDSLYELIDKTEDVLRDPVQKDALYKKNPDAKTSVAVAYDAEAAWEATDMGKDILQARTDLYGDENMNQHKRDGKQMSLGEFATVKVQATNGNPLLNKYAEGKDVRPTTKQLTDKVEEAKAVVEQKDQTPPVDKVFTQHSYKDGKDHKYGLLQNIPAEFADVKEDKNGNITGKIYNNLEHTGDYVEPAKITKEKDGSYDIQVELDDNNQIQCENDDKNKTERLTLAEFGHQMHKNFSDKVKSMGSKASEGMKGALFKLGGNFKSHIKDGWTTFRHDHPLITAPMMGTYYLGKGLGSAVSALGHGINSLMQTKEVHDFNQKVGDKAKAGVDSLKNKAGEKAYGKREWKSMQDHQEFLSDLKHPKDEEVWKKQVDQMLGDAKNISAEMKKNPMYSSDKAKWENAKALRDDLKAASQREDMPAEYKQKFIDLASDKDCDRMFTRSVESSARRFDSAARAASRDERVRAMDESIAKKTAHNEAVKNGEKQGSRMTMADFRNQHKLSHDDRVKAAEAVASGVDQGSAQKQEDVQMES